MATTGRAGNRQHSGDIGDRLPADPSETGQVSDPDDALRRRLRLRCGSNLSALLQDLPASAHGTAA